MLQIIKEKIWKTQALFFYYLFFIKALVFNYFIFVFIKWKNKIVKNKSFNLEDKSIAFFTNILFYENGELSIGGGEKYILNLINLFKNKGYKIKLFQTHGHSNIYCVPKNKNKSSRNIFYVDGIEIEIIDSKHKNLYEQQRYKCDVFYKKAKEFKYHVYCLPDLATGKIFKNSILISHGIWFDKNVDSLIELPLLNEKKRMKYTKIWKKIWLKIAEEIFSKFSDIITVDTNTFNISRTFFSIKTNFHYIPNFSNFICEKKDIKLIDFSKKIKILIPRRAVAPRGVYLMEGILENCKNIPNLEFTWVGGGAEKEETYLLNLQKKYNNFKFEGFARFDEMKKYYECFDIVLIPTLFSEGTSLSSIEALSFGKIVISTFVGGLSNLILDSYNGFFSNPNAYSFSEKIKYVLNQNINVLHEVQKKAHSSAQCLSSANWELKIINLFDKIWK